VNSAQQGYLGVVIPDDRAGRPLTPREQAAIADLERRYLLDTPVPVRSLSLAQPVRLRTAAVRRAVDPSSVGPLVALLGTACVLIAVLSVSGGGLLGASAVLASVAGTALLWPLLPVGLGGPVRRRAARLFRSRTRLPRRS
jgi:hypothetical protein